MADQRLSLDQLQDAIQRIQATPLLQQTIDAIDDAVLILNANRQVVAMNQALLKLLECKPEQALGLRPGELIGCEYAAEGSGGCGTGAHCSVCGALDVVLRSQGTTNRITDECRISLREPVGGSLDLKVSATSVDINNQRFTICFLADISDQKQLAVLARMFFHDVLNTAAGIRGYAELLREQRTDHVESTQELADLEELAEHLVEEIQMQRDLMYAESGDLQTEFTPQLVPQSLNRLMNLYSRHPIAGGRQLVLGEVYSGCIITDIRLLERVLGNMIKNALEASQVGGAVTIACVEQGHELVFSVHNQEVMPRAVQLQIFQRSFSTKPGSGRGIGTHSMKLFGERYLGGKVDFTSRPGEGTTFTVTLPKISFGEPTG